MTTAEVSRAFAAGFAIAAAPETRGRVRDGPPDGLPYRWSSERADRLESKLGAATGEITSLRYSMNDPAAFIREGRAREVYRRALTARAFPENTMAGATALMFATAWELANGQILSPVQNAAILSQTRSALVDNTLAKESDRMRQTETETRLIIAALWLEEARLRAGDPNWMRELSDAVHRDMLAVGDNDMRAHVVTADGFVDRN